MAEANEPKARDYSNAAKSLESALSAESNNQPAGYEGKAETNPEVPAEPEVLTQDPPPPPKDHDAENAERTRLGRRVKKLEDLIGELVTELRESRKTPTPLPDIPDVISTPEDVRKVVAIDREQERQKTQTYQDNYRKAIDALGEENQDIHEEVIKEILTPGSPFNQILSDNPFADAERNYYRCVKAVLKKKVATPVKPKVGVKGEKPITPTGVPTGTTVNAPNARPVKLDEYSKEFMRRLNLSDKFVEDALR